MKKTFITLSILLLALASCNDSNKEGKIRKKTSAICECADLSLKIMEEMENGASEDEVESKYTLQLEKCEKLTEGKSEEEILKLQKEFMECPAFKEFQDKLEQEMLENYDLEDSMAMAN